MRTAIAALTTPRDALGSHTQGRRQATMVT